MGAESVFNKGFVFLNGLRKNGFAFPFWKCVKRENNPVITKIDEKYMFVDWFIIYNGYFIKSVYYLSIGLINCNNNKKSNQFLFYRYFRKMINKNLWNVNGNQYKDINMLYNNYI